MATDSSTLRRRVISSLLLLTLCGCAIAGQDPLTGYLITSTTTPFTSDLNHTQVVAGGEKGSILRIREPFSGYGIYTELDSNAIADIASLNGLHTVYFADLETFSVFNVWRNQTLVIYGK